MAGGQREREEGLDNAEEWEGTSWSFLWMYQFLFSFLHFSPLPFSSGRTSPASPSHRLIWPVWDYLLPMWYRTVLRIWPQQDSWVRPLIEGWGGKGGVVLSSAPHSTPSGPKPNQLPWFKTMLVQRKACDRAVRQPLTWRPGSSTDPLK